MWHKGFAAPQHVESFQIKDQTCVPCIGRQILIHCTPREVPPIPLCIYVYVCIYLYINIGCVCICIHTTHHIFSYLFICWQCLDCFHIMATPHLITPTPARFFLPLNVRTARQGDNLPGLIWGKDRDLSLRLPVVSQNPSTSHFTSERPL